MKTYESIADYFGYKQDGSVSDFCGKIANELTTDPDRKSGFVTLGTDGWERDGVKYNTYKEARAGRKMSWWERNFG